MLMSRAGSVLKGAQAHSRCRFSSGIPLVDPGYWLSGSVKARRRVCKGKVTCWCAGSREAFLDPHYLQARVVPDQGPAVVRAPVSLSNMAGWEIF